MNANKLLQDYQYGCEFKLNDILKTRSGYACPFDIVDSTVVVLDKLRTLPPQYTVVGECLNPKTPADRFVTFDINGHNWEKVGVALNSPVTIAPLTT